MNPAPSHAAGEPADRATPRRGPHEVVEPPPPDPRLPGVRRIGALAHRRAALAEAELARAQRACDDARLAADEAEQALQDCIADVAVRRKALLEARQAEPGGSPDLRRWRQADQAQIDRIGAARDELEARKEALAAAEAALLDVLVRQRALARRREKYTLLEERLRDGD